MSARKNLRNFATGLACCCLYLLLSIPTATGVSAGDEDLPEGYRGWPYKAPTPLSVPGATTLFFAEDVQALIHSTDILLVNVSPITLGPADVNGNRTWIPRQDKSSQQLPGSIWLPNVGYASLDADMDAYFRKNLAHYSDGDKSRLIMFYCTADCWMSWNSVKRAREEYGYRNLYWYPYGTDGWKEQDLELEQGRPEPFSANLDLPDA